MLVTVLKGHKSGIQKLQPSRLPSPSSLGFFPFCSWESLLRPQTPTKSLRKGNSVKQRPFLQVIIQRMHNSHSSDKSTTKIFKKKKRWGRGFCLLKTKIGQESEEDTLGGGCASCLVTQAPLRRHGGSGASLSLQQKPHAAWLPETLGLAGALGLWSHVLLVNAAAESHLGSLIW